MYPSVTIDFSVVADDGENTVFFIGGQIFFGTAKSLETRERVAIDVVVPVGDNAYPRRKSLDEFSRAGPGVAVVADL